VIGPGSIFFAWMRTARSSSTGMCFRQLRSNRPRQYNVLIRFQTTWVKRPFFLPWWNPDD
jgi:hypothetical protein